MSGEQVANDRELRMAIRSLMLDPTSSVPIVILRDEETHKILPIWIGVFEASAIAARIDGQTPPRPLTHDLLLSGLEIAGATVQKVLISDLQDATFFAQIHLTLEGDRRGEGRSAGERREGENSDVAEEPGSTMRILDARPSDAIALALRAEVPIFVLESVLLKAQASEMATEESDDERLRKWLEEVSPEELGKYTM